MDPGLNLSATVGEPVANPSLYRRMISYLMYLTISRLDINFAISKLSQYMADPRIPHEQALLHLLRYIKSSHGQGLLFSANSKLVFNVFTDADWGSYLDTRHSTVGIMVFSWEFPDLLEDKEVANREQVLSRG